MEMVAAAARSDGNKETDEARRFCVCVSRSRRVNGVGMANSTLW